ncbi:MAG: putative Ig domain-containing protein, partial [Candidatus Omnitrophota bacterium]
MYRTRYFKKLVFIIAAVFYTLIAYAEGAFAATLTLAPANGTYNIGTSFDVDVILNTEGESVQGVKAHITFDDSILQANSIEKDDSWGFSTPDMGIEGNLIRFEVGTISPLNGSNIMVGTIQFEAAHDGVSVVEFNSETEVNRTGNFTDILSETTGGSYTVGNPDNPPVLNPIGDQSIDEGGSLNIEIVAHDPDGDPINISASGLQPWMNYESNFFSAAPGYEHAGSYDVIFTATANGKSVSETITVTVNNVDQTPVLAAIHNQNVLEGEDLSFDVTASDPDGDSVTVTAGGLESWMSFNGTAFSASPDFGDAGSYDVTFTATANGKTDSETITISVGNVDRAPELAAIGNKSVDENGELNFNVSASDPDGDSVTVTAGGLESWMSFNGTAFSASPDFGDAGSYDVTFTATANGKTDSETITISVGNV